MLQYALEAPRRSASNEYPQHMFPWRKKKPIFIGILLSSKAMIYRIILLVIACMSLRRQRFCTEE